MDPVLPPGPEWLRRRQLIEERKVADLERRLRAPSVRSLADLDDTAIDYLSEPPSDGDTLVFDESLGNDLSPAGRWRPGAGGGGGGSGWASIRVRGATDVNAAIASYEVLWAVSEGLEAPQFVLPDDPIGGVVLFGADRGGIWSVAAQSGAAAVQRVGSPWPAGTTPFFGAAYQHLVLDGERSVSTHFLLPESGGFWPADVRLLTQWTGAEWESAEFDVSAHWVGPSPAFVHAGT